jgi:hypothetical protein
MQSGKEISFDQYLDMIFAGSGWLEACTTMLAVFSNDIESCRENPGEGLPEEAPSILDQVTRVAERARRLETSFRELAHERGARFQTIELGSTLWWAGLASHKAAGGIERVQKQITRQAWEDVFIDLHTLIFDVISALSLLGIAEQLVSRMELEAESSGRSN